MNEMPVYGIVYLTSRLFQGEIVNKYVGRHKWINNKCNDKYLGSGKRLINAIKKYGKSCFIRETLEECYSHEDLNKAEAYWVKKLNCVKDPLFYNLADGGMNTGNLNGIEVHQYTLEGDYINSFKNSKEVTKILNIDASAIRKSIKHLKLKSVGGFQWKSYKIDKIPSIEEGVIKKVKVFNLKGEFLKEFSSMLEAAKYASCKHYGNISDCCKLNRKMANGYQWRYSNHKDLVTDISSSRKKLRIVYKKCQVTGILLEKFKNSKFAAKSVNCHLETIVRYVKLEKPFRGYLWSYAN